MTSILQIALANAVVSALLAGIVLGVTRAVRAPQLAHALWVLVVLKLVTPPLVALPEIRSTAMLPAESQRSIATSLRSRTGIDAAIEDPQPALLVADRPTTESVLAETAIADLATDSFDPLSSFDWQSLLLFVWAGGSLLIAVVGIRRVWRFSRLASETELADEAVRAEARELAAKIGLRRTPEVRIVDGAVPPVVWAAAGRPMILLPAALLERLDPVSRRAILAHELAHVRRGDHWVRRLEALVSLLYWWNPLVWFIRRRLNHAEELCCDRWVLWLVPGCREQYARAVIETIDFLAAARTPLPVLASGIGSFFPLKTRITAILGTSGPHRLSWPATLAIAVAAAVTLPIATLPGLGFELLPQIGEKDSPAAAPVAATPKANDPEPEGALVMGTIVSADGAPVAGVAVVAWRQDGRRERVLRSDAEGRIFAPQEWWENPQYSGELFVLAARGPEATFGWFEVPTSRGGWPPADPPFPPPKPFRITLETLDRELSGRLVDQEQRPIAGARVQVQSLSGAAANVHLYDFPMDRELPLPSTTTDEAGRFRVKVPRQANVTLQAMHPDWVTRYVTPRPADDLGDIPMLRGVRLRGKVTFAGNGRPAPGMQVRAERWNAVRERSMRSGKADDSEAHLAMDGRTITGPDGTFEIGGLKADQYNLDVKGGPDPAWLAPSLTFELLPEGIAPVEVTLEEGKRITGKVIESASGNPVRKAYVTVNSRREDPRWIRWCSYESTWTGDNGEFEFHVLPGAGYIETSPPQSVGWKFLPESTTRFDFPREGESPAIVLKLEREKEGLLRPPFLRAFGLGPTSAFSFAPDGKRIALTGYHKDPAAPEPEPGKPIPSRGHLSLWDPSTSNELIRFGGDFGAPLDIAFSPDGKTLVSGGGTLESLELPEVTLWNAETGQPIRQLVGHTRRVRGVAWSPDGTMIATAGTDRTLRIWDPKDGTQRTVLNSPSRISHPLFTPDSKTLIAAWAPGTIKLWNTETWQERSTIADPSIGIEGLTLSPDGRFVAIAGIPYEPDGKSQSLTNGGLVRLWHIPSGLSRATWRVEHYPTSIAFSPDGRHVAVCGYKSTVWSVESREEVAVITRAASSSGDRICFSPDGLMVLTSGFNGGMHAWDVSALGAADAK